MWSSEDYFVGRGQDVREERVDSSVHQVEDGQDEDEEAGEQPHPGVGQEEVEGGAGQAQGARPPPVILRHRAEGEGDRGDAADVLGADRDGLRHAQAVLVLGDGPPAPAHPASHLPAPVLAAAAPPPAPASTSRRVS